MKTTLLLPALALATLLPASATLVIYEPFDISSPGDVVNGKATGEGLSGNWTGYDSSANLVIGSGSLSYGGLATSGNHVMLSTATDGRTGYRAEAFTSLNAAGLMDHGATLWFSFLNLHPSNNTNNRVHFLLGTDGTNAGANSIANSGSGIGLEINASGGNRLSAMTFTAGTRANSAQTILPLQEVSMIVGRIDWGANAATADTITLYLPDTDLNLGTAVQTISATLDQSAFSYLVLAGKWDAPIVDEIRFGSTYASVSPVPEPTAALLGSFGLLMLLRRRR